MSNTTSPSNESQRLKYRLTLKFKYSPRFFILDQLLRIFFVYCYVLGYFPTWLFFLLNALLMGLMLYIYNLYTDGVEREFLTKINSKYSELGKTEFQYSDDAPTNYGIILYVIGFFFSTWFFYQLTDEQYHNLPVMVLMSFFAFPAAFIFFIPYYITARYHIDKLISYEVEEAISYSIDEDGKEVPVYEDVTNSYQDFLLMELENQEEYHSLLDITVDKNDVKIARIESELKSINHRADAWIIESVFLGGLSFSSFLTVLAANFLGKESVVFTQFIQHIFKLIEVCSSQNFSEWITRIEGIFFRKDLYILIMFLCLLSSVFFLLVLTLRLRLNSLSLNMDYLLRVMTIFNAKEEELYNLQQSSEFNEVQIRRLQNFEKKIDNAIKDAEKLLKELSPIALMMGLYRNIAVFLFYLVLIISGFYFSPFVSGLIFTLAMITLFYRLFNVYTKESIIKELIKKH